MLMNEYRPFNSVVFGWFIHGIFSTARQFMIKILLPATLALITTQLLAKFLNFHELTPPFVCQ